MIRTVVLPILLLSTALAVPTWATTGPLPLNRLPLSIQRQLMTPSRHQFAPPTDRDAAGLKGKVKTLTTRTVTLTTTGGATVETVDPLTPARRVITYDPAGHDIRRVDIDVDGDDDTLVTTFVRDRRVSSLESSGGEELERCASTFTPEGVLTSTRCTEPDGTLSSLLTAVVYAGGTIEHHAANVIDGVVHHDTVHIHGADGQDTVAYLTRGRSHHDVTSTYVGGVLAQQVTSIGRVSPAEKGRVVLEAEPPGGRCRDAVVNTFDHGMLVRESVCGDRLIGDRVTTHDVRARDAHGNPTVILLTTTQLGTVTKTQRTTTAHTYF